MSKATQFQVKLSGDWKDYSKDEDRVLKRAFLAGFPHARYSLRGQRYECNFAKMTQKNVASGKVREMRAPHKWTAPSAPICKAGPTMCVRVPEGAAGTVFHVPHPTAKGQFISVEVPSSARVGQTMLVPIPDAKPMAEDALAASAPTMPAALAPAHSTPAKQEKKVGWSTGAKVAAVGAVGGLAVAGVVLGEHIAEEGWDATLEDLGGVATTVGEGIADGAEAAVDWVGDAADTTGDFIMDLF
mmetsp:Transcript_36653/g.80029  ORF Transcript_36653/g.80029 Transcript_36653/m.80029 type:complete len:243 (+) Transcript_36653:91-819(+)